MISQSCLVSLSKNIVSHKNITIQCITYRDNYTCMNLLFVKQESKFVFLIFHIFLNLELENGNCVLITAFHVFLLQTAINRLCRLYTQE